MDRDATDRDVAESWVVTDCDVCEKSMACSCVPLLVVQRFFSFSVWLRVQLVLVFPFVCALSVVRRFHFTVAVVSDVVRAKYQDVFIFRARVHHASTTSTACTPAPP